MGPVSAATVMLDRGVILDAKDPGSSLVSIFDLANEAGGGFWSELSFSCAYIYLGYRGKILCYSEGWYALPPHRKEG